jgi:predicted transcriptional regulator
MVNIFKITKEEFLEFTKNEPKTQKELTEHFNVSTRTITRLVIRHNLSKDFLKKEYKISKEKFLEFVKNRPKTMRQVLKYFNVDKKTVYIFLKRHNLPYSILCRQKKINLINKKQ